MPAGQQLRNIKVQVTGEGIDKLRSIAEQLGGINKNTKQLAQGFNLLTSITSTFLGGLGVNQLAGFSDEIQNINNRLVAMAGSQEVATIQMAGLVQVSRDTNQSLQATSDIYLRLDQSLKRANISQGSLLEITETLVNTFRLSGKSADEAAAGVNSMAVAFQLGGIQGRELRTILRSNTELAILLKKEFGGELFSGAQNGFLTVGKLMEVLHKNMGQVNSDAQKMTATFAQSATKALDAFKLKLFDLNQALGVSSGFAVAVQFLIKNMGALSTVLAAIAITTIPLLVGQISKLSLSLVTLNPLAAGLAVGLLGVAAAFGEKLDITSLITQLEVGFSRAKAILYDFHASFLNVLSDLTPGDISQKLKKQADTARQTAQDLRVHAQALWIEHDAQEALSQVQAVAAAKWAEDLKKINASFTPDLNPAQILAQLNAQFRAGTIDVTEYNKQILRVDLAKANKEFQGGKYNLDQLNEAQKKVDILELNAKFKDSTIGIYEYNTALRAIDLRNLNQQLQSGKISLSEFDSKLASVSDEYSTNGAFRTGLQDYLTSIGTTTSQVASTIKSAFGELENVFVEFVKTGKFNFDKFTQNILDDLTKIIFRAAIIQPIASGILGYLHEPAAASVPQSPGGTGNYIQAAHGYAFDKGLTRFASGGIVSTPTVFGYGQSKAGLMGEAGPEAILPLKRGSGGDLGVKATVTPVTVNIINQSGNEVQQTESTGPDGARTIEVLITGKVKEGIVGGAFDKVMAASYGLRRKGS